MPRDITARRMALGRVPANRNISAAYTNSKDFRQRRADTQQSMGNKERNTQPQSRDLHHSQSAQSTHQALVEMQFIECGSNREPPKEEKDDRIEKLLRD